MNFFLITKTPSKNESILSWTCGVRKLKKNKKYGKNQVCNTLLMKATKLKSEG